MKHCLFLSILLAAILAESCSSSSGSVTFPVNETVYTPQDTEYDYSSFASLFEIVPGSYTVSWKRVDKLPQIQNFEVSLKLKLRLLKSVTLSENIVDMDGMQLYGLLGGVKFILTDQNGETFDWTKTGVPGFGFGIVSVKQMAKTGGLYDKDELLDFALFLQSPVGTEYDCSLVSTTSTTKDRDFRDYIKQTRGVMGVVQMPNHQFNSRYKFK